MSLLFNGSSDIVVGPALTVGAAATYFARIYPVSVGENSLGTILHHGPDATQRGKLSLLTGSKLRFAAKWATTEGVWESPANITLSAWQSVAATYLWSSTANNPSLYIDHVSQTVTRTSAPAGSAPSDGGIPYAGNRVGLDHTFDGKIGELAVWNRALSAAEIEAVDLLGVLAVPNGLKLWWPMYFDARDYSGNGVDGTMQGPVLDEDPPQASLYRSLAIPVLSTLDPAIAVVIMKFEAAPGATVFVGIGVDCSAAQMKLAPTAADLLGQGNFDVECSPAEMMLVPGKSSTGIGPVMVSTAALLFSADDRFIVSDRKFVMGKIPKIVYTATKFQKG